MSILRLDRGSASRINTTRFWQQLKRITAGHLNNLTQWAFTPSVKVPLAARSHEHSPQLSATFVREVSSGWVSGAEYVLDAPYVEQDGLVYSISLSTTGEFPTGSPVPTLSAKIREVGTALPFIAVALTAGDDDEARLRVSRNITPTPGQLEWTSAAGKRLEVLIYTTNWPAGYSDVRATVTVDIRHKFTAFQL